MGIRTRVSVKERKNITRRLIRKKKEAKSFIPRLTMLPDYTKTTRSKKYLEKPELLFTYTYLYKNVKHDVRCIEYGHRKGTGEYAIMRAYPPRCYVLKKRRC